MLAIKTHTKAFKAFKDESRKESKHFYCSIRPTGRYFTLNGGKSSHKDKQCYEIMSTTQFTHYAPDNCSYITVPNGTFKIDKVYGSKYTIRFILRTNENSAGLHGPEYFYNVNAKWCTKTKKLTNVVVQKYDALNKQWNAFATRNSQITRTDLALFILQSNYESAQKRFKGSVDAYADYVKRTGDYS